MKKIKIQGRVESDAFGTHVITGFLVADQDDGMVQRGLVFVPGTSVSDPFLEMSECNSDNIWKPISGQAFVNLSKKSAAFFQSEVEKDYPKYFYEQPLLDVVKEFFEGQKNIVMVSCLVADKRGHSSYKGCSLKEAVQVATQRKEGLFLEIQDTNTGLSKQYSLREAFLKLPEWKKPVKKTLKIK